MRQINKSEQDHIEWLRNFLLSFMPQISFKLSRLLIFSTLVVAIWGFLAVQVDIVFLQRVLFVLVFLTMAAGVMAALTTAQAVADHAVSSNCTASSCH